MERIYSGVAKKLFLILIQDVLIGIIIVMKVFKIIIIFFLNMNANNMY